MLSKVAENERITILQCYPIQHHQLLITLKFFITLLNFFVTNSLSSGSPLPTGNKLRKYL